MTAMDTETGATAGAVAGAEDPQAETARRRRADAHRNRLRILAAARDVIVEDGPDAPLDRIARRAGVGNATLYRHFGDRGELLGEVAKYVVGQIADDAEAALAEEADPFQALRRYLHACADRRIGAVLPAVRGRFAKDETFFAVRDRGMRAVEEIMRLAQNDGSLRRDVAVTDIWLVLMRVTRPLPDDDCSVFEGHIGRHIELVLAGLRAPAADELPGSAFTLADLRHTARAPAARSGPRG